MTRLPYLLVALSVLGMFSSWLGEIALRLREHAPKPASPVPRINVSFRGLA